MTDNKVYKCIDCEHFSLCKVTEGYCFNHSQYVDRDSDICDDFRIDDFIRALEVIDYDR